MSPTEALSAIDVPVKTAPFIIGLTGPIGSGKSTVAGLLRECGATVIDADAVYASLAQPGRPLLQAIAAEFGADVLRPDGSLDRRALGDLVFDDSTALSRLDRLTHPAVVAEIERQIAAANSDVVVIEAIKLVQSGLARRGDAIWLVTAAPEARVQRVMERDDLDLAAARKRVAAAIDPTLDASVPVTVIDNSGDHVDLRQRVDAAWQQVEKRIADRPEPARIADRDTVTDTDRGENR